MNNWCSQKLADLVEIRVSNVDKKIYSHKKLIFLCNYMDVYKNNYITRDIPFSIGSADANELAKFSLFQDDVLITKDSETPDDIAIPGVIIENIPNLVCGYHLAILRPKNNYISGLFLMQMLRLPLTQRYFYKIASGSTRYGLTLGGIQNARISFPPYNHQQKIATILSTIDRAIENTEALIAKYQQIKTGLMHDLFTRGIGEDGTLRPPRAEAPELYKETEIGWIPREWKICDLNHMVSFIRSGLSRLLSEDDIGIPVIISGNIQNFEMDYSHLRYWYRHDPQGANVEDYILKEEDILLCFINSLDQIGKVALFKGFDRPCIYTTNLFRIRASCNVTPTFLYFLLATPFIQKELKLISKPAVNQASFTTKDFLKIKVPYINSSEQLKICRMLQIISDYITKENSTLSKLQNQKTGLMHDLLTGKVEVTPPKSPEGGL